MQHLDRRFEHFDKLEHALVGQAQPARIAVGIRVILGVLVELANVHLAHQGGDVLVVLVAGLGLGDGGLAQHRRVDAGHAELVDVTVEFFHALDGPGRHDPGQIAPRDAIVGLQRVAVLFRCEQPERGFIYGRALQRVDGLALHQLLEALGDGRLPAAHRPEQIQDLLSLFQALRSMLEEGDDLGDRVFHAVELGERGIALDETVGEDARQPLVEAGVDQLGLADRRQHALRGGGVDAGVLPAQVEVFLEGHLVFVAGRVSRLVSRSNLDHGISPEVLGLRSSVGGL